MGKYIAIFGATEERGTEYFKQLVDYIGFTEIKSTRNKGDGWEAFLFNDSFIKVFPSPDKAEGIVYDAVAIDKEIPAIEVAGIIGRLSLSGVISGADIVSYF